MYIPLRLLQQNEQHYPVTREEVAARKEQIKRLHAIQLDGLDHMRKRLSMLKESAQEPADEAFDRYTGDNSLLPVNYLQIGYARSRAVGRLRRQGEGYNRAAGATAFMISDDLLMTCNHVLDSIDKCNGAYIDFDYCYNSDGNAAGPVTFAIEADRFFYTNEALDFTVVAVERKDVTGIHDIRSRGHLKLTATQGKAGIGDRSNIITHANGGHQQLGISGMVLDINHTDVLMYEALERGCASGSPVFNDQWQVIALHSAGIAAKDASGSYTDKEGSPVAAADGKVDGRRIEWVAATGTRISAILKCLATQASAAGNSLLMTLAGVQYAAAHKRKKRSSNRVAAGTVSSGDIIYDGGKVNVNSYAGVIA